MYKNKVLCVFLVLALMSCSDNKIPTVKVIEKENNIPPLGSKKSSEYLKDLGIKDDLFLDYFNPEVISLTDKNITNNLNFENQYLSNESPNKLYRGIANIKDFPEIGKIEKLEDGEWRDVFLLDRSLMGSNVEHDINSVAAGNNLFVFHSDHVKVITNYIIDDWYDLLIPVINIDGVWQQCRVISPEKDYHEMNVLHIAEDGKSFYAFSEKNGKPVVFRYEYNENRREFKGKIVFSGGPSKFGKSFTLYNPEESVLASPSFEYVALTFRNEHEESYSFRSPYEWIIQIYRVFNDEWELVKELTFLERLMLYPLGFYQDCKYFVVEGGTQTSIYSIEDDFQKILEMLPTFSKSLTIKDDQLYILEENNTILKLDLLSNKIDRIAVFDSDIVAKFNFIDNETVLLNDTLYHLENSEIKPLETNLIEPKVEDSSKSLADSKDFLLKRNGSIVTVFDLNDNPLYKIPIEAGQTILYFDGNYLMLSDSTEENIILYKKIDDSTWSKEFIPIPFSDNNVDRATICNDYLILPIPDYKVLFYNLSGELTTLEKCLYPSLMCNIYSLSFSADKSLLGYYDIDNELLAIYSMKKLR